MVHGIYVIYDKVGQISSPVFQAINDGVALREFRALISKVEAYDQDAFVLKKVGEYDDVECTIQKLLPFDIFENVNLLKQ